MSWRRTYHISESLKPTTDPIVGTPGVSIIIPAFNEADYLPLYMPTVIAAMQHWQDESRMVGEIIVVDNASTDATAQIACEFGVCVVKELTRNIACARNRGAAVAKALLLVFLDADVAIPPQAISVAVAYMQLRRCIGGAIPPVYTPSKFGARLLCKFWDRYRTRKGTAQGVAQFCTAAAFKELGGYRADLYMSEDVEFFCRLRQLGAQKEQPVAIVEELSVRPSTRRYDRWPTWRMVFWQNPITARSFLSSHRFWRHWYDTTVR